LPSITASARQPDHDHALQPEDERVRAALQDPHVLHAHARVGLVHHEVLVGRAPLRLAQVQLDRHHPAQRLDEVRPGAGLVGQLLVGGVALRVEEDPSAAVRRGSAAPTTTDVSVRL
jgi:hypothetical protein